MVAYVESLLGPVSGSRLIVMFIPVRYLYWAGKLKNQDVIHHAERNACDHHRRQLHKQLRKG